MASTASVNPPCDGTDSTCGITYTRDVSCYVLAPGVSITTPDWMKNSFVTTMDQCVKNSAKAYDPTGKSVTIPANNNWQVTTNCDACNYVIGVEAWTHPCECGTTDTCTAGPDVNGTANPFGTCKASGSFCHVLGCAATSTSSVKNSYNPNMKNTNTPSQMHNMKLNSNTPSQMHNMKLNSNTPSQMHNMRSNTNTTQPPMHCMNNNRLYNMRSNTNTTPPPMHYMNNNNMRFNTNTPLQMHYRYNNHWG
jgi:hypothetical protein